jgi:O-acetyl-ADP-ribose deacetylase (regulator of RNase III)
MNQLIAEHDLDSRRQLHIVQGDITLENVDAIVNAANSQLNHGGGVAGAIVKRGGTEIQSESNAWVREHGFVKHDSPAFTSAGKLRSRYVIHAVGPVWGEGNEDEKLRAAFWGSLRLGDSLQIRSIAFPALSTGIFGFPKSQAAEIFYRTVQEYFEEFPLSGLEIVRLTLFDQETVDIFLKVWESKFNFQSMISDIKNKLISHIKR